MEIAPATQTGAAGARLSYTLTLYNDDGASCAATVLAPALTLPDGWRGEASAIDAPIAPGSSARATLTLTSPAGAADGSYRFAVTVAHPADSALAASATATYTVERAACTRAAPLVRVERVSAANTDAAVVPGSKVSYRVHVTNQDGAPCPSSRWTFFVTVPGSQWRAAMTGWRDVAAGQTDSVGLALTVPAGAADGRYRFGVIASANGLSGRASSELEVRAPTCQRLAPEVRLTAAGVSSGRAGTMVRYLATVTNRDSRVCEPATFTLRAVLPARFSANDPEPLSLAAGASATALLDVRSSLLLPAGAYTVRLRAEHGADASLAGEASVTYTVSQGLVVTVQPVRRPVLPGERVALGLRVTLDGQPLQQGSAQVLLTSPDGARVERRVDVRDGVAHVGYRASARAVLGRYRVGVRVRANGKSADAVRDFVVAAAPASAAFAASDRGDARAFGGCAVAPPSARGDDASSREVPTLPTLLLLLLVVATRGRRAR